MKALKYVVFLVLLLIIGSAIFIAVQPNSFKVERSRTIKAPVAVVYNNVVDLKNWEAWSSWVEEDPNMTIILGDQTKGVGGSYSWQDEDGIGTMKTIAAIPNDSIAQEMQFAEFPKSAVNWKFVPNEDGSTDVTWSIEGKDLGFGFKAFATVMGGMESQIGPNYERSLEKLDSLLLADMKKYSISVEGVTYHSGGFYLYNSTSCRMDNFKEKMQEKFPQIGGYAMANNIQMAGSPFVIYHKFDEANNAVVFSCAVPTSSRIEASDPEILTGQLEPFKTVKTVLKGDYENLKEAWAETMTYIVQNNLEMVPNGPMIESYPKDPSQFPNPADWVTEIFIPVY